VESEGQQMKQC